MLNYVFINCLNGSFFQTQDQNQTMTVTWILLSFKPKSLELFIGTAKNSGSKLKLIKVKASTFCTANWTDLRNIQNQKSRPRHVVLWDEPIIELECQSVHSQQSFWPLTASITIEVKNEYAYVTTQRILNKFIEINFLVGCMVWP